jgi:hypothetical protein
MFATTRWSLVLAARGRPSPEAQAALADLCRVYWYPLYAFVRRSGYGHDDAMDLTQHTHGRSGRPGARPRGEIGYHAIRGGDDPGQHTILFGMLGEKLELRVAATNRDCYAQGALLAAQWLAGKPPGLYNMQDVLRLD